MVSGTTMCVAWDASPNLLQVLQLVIFFRYCLKKGKTEGRRMSDEARWNLIHPKVNCDHSFHAQTESETAGGVWYEVK